MGLAAFRPDRFVTLVAALVSPEERQLRYVNAGHPPVALWGRTRELLWLQSTGPLVSPVLTTSTWEAPVVPIDEGDHLLLYTDGISEALADDDGRAEERFTSVIDRASEGGAPLLNTILADVHHQLAGRPQPDDLTLLTARVLGPTRTV
jgi:sigma-B regulation protein RsbU (phosphoserine phosphatase)